jgi:hypothetical protein
MDGPLPIERSEDRDQPGVEQLPDERIGEHVADEAATRGRGGGVTHPGEDTRRGRALFGMLMHVNGYRGYA